MEVGIGVLIGGLIAFVAVELSQQKSVKILGDPEAQKKHESQWKQSIDMERQRLKLQAEQLKATKETNELLGRLISDREKV